MSQKLLRTLVSLTLVIALGCDDDDGYAETDYTPSTVEDGLFYAPTAPEQNEQHALVLDVSGDEPKTTAYELPGGTVTALPRPGSNGREVVLLTAGLEAVRTGKHKRAAVASSVSIFGRAGELLRKPLQGRYRSLSLSPDGRYGIAFGSTAGLSVDNSAEVIDFMSDAAPVFVDLSLDARAPSYFEFSPANAFPHRIAVAPQPNALQILDLEHPERGPISITLSVKSTQVPTQLVFAGDRMFVRSENSTSIVVLQAIEVAKGNHPWQLAPQEHFATSVVRDIAVTGQGASQRLLALTGSLEVFDPAIGPTAKIDGVAGFSRILQFVGTSPIDSNAVPRAMLYGTVLQERGTSSVSTSQVGFVDLGDETAWSTRNVEVVELGDTVLRLTEFATRKIALAYLNTGRAGVIDLQARTVRRLVLDEYNGTLLVDETGSAARLWARGVDGALGRVDLDSFARIELPMAFGPGPDLAWGGDSATVAPDMLLLPSLQHRRIAVLQRGRTGRVTFLDADAPSGEAAAESALEVLGVYLHDLLH